MAQLNSLLVTGDSRFLNTINGNISGDAGTVNNHTVEKDVPSDAVFTDVSGNNKLPLAGGTMTGTLNCKANVYTDAYTGSLNMGNSNIYGVNAIYTADAAEGAGEGINFYRDTTHVDTLWMAGGDLLFVPNRVLGTSTTKADSQKVGRFTANPTTGQVVITDGTTGGMKSSGYTIAKSVPANAVFTDTTYSLAAGTGDDANKIVLTPSSGTANKITVPYATSAGSATPTSHTHGNIANGGTISSTAVTPANTDYILISDTSASGKIERGIAVGSGTTKFLREDGSWQTPAYPTVNNAALNLQLGGTTKKTFTANADTAVTANFVFTAGTTPSTVTKKTVVTSATFNTVVTGCTKKTVVTSASGATAAYSNGVLTLTDGSFSTGDSVTVTTGASGSATTGDSVTVTAGTAPSLAIS